MQVRVRGATLRSTPVRTCSAATAAPPIPTNRRDPRHAGCAACLAFAIFGLLVLTSSPTSVRKPPPQTRRRPDGSERPGLRIGHDKSFRSVHQQTSYPMSTAPSTVSGCAGRLQHGICVLARERRHQLIYTFTALSPCCRRARLRSGNSTKSTNRRAPTTGACTGHIGITPPDCR